MDTEALSSVTSSPKDVLVSRGGCRAGQEPSVPQPQQTLLAEGFGFFLQGAGEQRSHFLTKTTCERRGNATGADLKENMLTM